MNELIPRSHGRIRAQCLLSLLFVGAACRATPSTPQPWAGAWAGSLRTSGDEVGLRVTIAGDHKNARFTAPHFGWFDLATKVTVRGRTAEVRLDVYSHRASLKLEAKGGALHGTFRGWGTAGEVMLARMKPDRVPFTSRNFDFESHGSRMRGTLLTPRGKGPFPAVVWTHGSGRVNRENPIYRSLAAWITEHGVASLIYDKRPPTAEATMQVLGEDAVAGVRALQREANIRRDIVGVGGMSQGGWIAPIAAAKSAAVGFVVALSAPGCSPGEQNLFNQRNKVLDAGFDTAAADASSHILRRIYGYLRTGKNQDTVWSELLKSRSQPWFQAAYELPIWHRRGLPKAPWKHRAALDFDPQTVWSKVRVPVVCCWGGNDRLIPANLSRARIRTWLTAAGNRQRELVILSEGSHDLRSPPSRPWSMGALPPHANAVPRFIRSLAEPTFQPPKTDRGSDAYELHGVTVPDPFRWLETAGDKREAWAKAQDRVTDRAFAADPFVASLRDRLPALNAYARAPVPSAAGGRQFDSLRPPGEIYSQIRVRGAGENTFRTLVSPDKHPASPEHRVALGMPVPSPDGRYILFGASSQSLRSCVRVVDVASGKDLANDAVGIRYHRWRTSWLPDSSGFLYVDRAAVKCHRIGTKVDSDLVVFQSTALPAPHLAPHIAADGRTILITAFHPENDTTRVHALEFDPKEKPARISEPRMILGTPEGRYQVLGCRGKRAFVYTTVNAANGRVIAVDLDRPTQRHWVEIVKEHEHPVVDGNHPVRPTVALFGDRIAALYARDGGLRLRAHDLEGKLIHEIVHGGVAFNESGLVGRGDTAVVRYDVQSMFDPGSAYETDLHTGETRLLGRPVVPFDPTEFEINRKTYISFDGTTVPIILAHKKGIVRDGTNATLISNWAVQGLVPRPLYLPELHAWVESGGVLALPCARGCGEFGGAWHKAGAGPNKITALDDLASAAHWLAKSGISRADRIGIMGASMSAAPSTATLMRHPNSFGAGLIEIPRIDLLAHRAWVEEYGNTRDSKEFAIMRKWMPLANATPRRYPPILIQVGSADRVAPPYHGYKLAAALQSTQRGSAPIFLNVVWGVGHALGRGIPQRCATQAQHLGFLARSLELRPRE